MPTTPTPPAPERPDTTGVGPGTWNGVYRLWNMLKQLIGDINADKEHQGGVNDNINQGLQDALDKITQQGGSLADLASRLDKLFIPGGIQYFYGSLGGSDGKRLVPLGASASNESWVFCDGSNGTPDLRGRFIVGVGGEYYPNDKGGAKNHDHTVAGSMGSTTLSVSQMPEHQHSIPVAGGFADDNYGAITSGYAPASVTKWTDASGSSQSHDHSLSASTSSTSNLPPYYALYPFMFKPAA